MRNPDRITPFVQAFERLWRHQPSLPFGWLALATVCPNRSCPSLALAHDGATLARLQHLLGEDDERGAPAGQRTEVEAAVEQALRSPGRIRPLMRAVERLWQRNSDLRFGQLVVWAAAPDAHCPHFVVVEDAPTLERLHATLAQLDAATQADAFTRRWGSGTGNDPEND